ncbi:hypothetical protein ACX1N5_11795 [Acinetobacter sp. ANC 4636]
MDLIIRFFDWVSNCFLSGKVQALGIVLIGVLLSSVFLKLSPIIIKGAIFLYPDVGQYLEEHFIGFQIGLFAAYMTPTLICAYIAFKQFQYIYYKESYHGF